MRVAVFCQSLLSDWDHESAHFLRGVVTELVARGNDVRVFEPHDAWSVRNLVADYGVRALEWAREAFPAIDPVRYDAQTLDLDEALDGCDLALVHDRNEPELVQRIGARRAAGGRCRLFFHDTRVFHDTRQRQRSVNAPDPSPRVDLSAYDGVLAFAEAVRQVYLSRGWAASRVWTWHEAADVRVFQPMPAAVHEIEGDLVWIGNWGDGEDARELTELLLDPARSLGLRGTAYGVRYPPEGKQAFAAAGMRYAGWLPNFRVPHTLGRHRFTVHVPRPHRTRPPGIATIRLFEALACGAALASAAWDDVEGLFTPGKDYLVAAGGAEMRRHMRALAQEPELRRELGEHGRATVLARHTCAHRVDELMQIVAAL
jgi:spore maturation protein CgeB